MSDVNLVVNLMDSSREVAFPLKVVIDKTKRKVVFAEANSDFVDVLFSFLTLPMGTIVRLLHQHSDQTQPYTNIGSFNNLYKSIANLDAKYFTTQEFKNMLLNTRNSAEAECRKLKMNIDDTKPIQYFICNDIKCTRYSDISSLSTYNVGNCTRCGKFIDRPIGFQPDQVGSSERNLDDGAFVTELASFVITEDLHVIPNLVGSTLGLIESNGIIDFGVLEEKTLEFGRNEFLLLLECSIVSKAPLDDIVFGRKDINLNIAVPSLRSHISSPGINSDNKMTMKVFFQRSNNRILFGQTSADFVNLLFSFLTIPVGRVNSLLSNNYTPTLCVENIHQSVSDLNVDGYLKTQQMKEMLLSPPLARRYLLSSHMFPLEEEPSTPTLYFTGIDSQNRSYLSFKRPFVLNITFMFANPKQGGFVRRQTVFMITDDLTVSPLSSVSCLTYIHCLKVPPSDIEEQELSIGVEEALNMLRASLSSTSVLTNSLQHLILKNPKQEILLKKPKEEA